MRPFKFVPLCLCTLFILSCADNSAEKQNRELKEEQDRLKSQISEQDAQLAELQSCLELLNNSMDSIAIQEHILFLPDVENPNLPLNKKMLNDRLDVFAELISRQRDLISSLEDSLDTQNQALASLRRLISNYKVQIEQKDAEIIRMKEELNQKNVSIASLRGKVSRMESDIKTKDSDIDYLLNVSDQQQKIMETQDNILNEGYYIVKTKKELSSLGIKSNDISKANINLSDFKKVDIREFAGLTISSNRVKILSQMPASSYSLTTNGDGTITLDILSPADFWQYSNILIIQTR